MPIGDLRRDGRGRHTTRHRQLLVLRDGSIPVDTPGLRELQIWEGDVDSAFSDVAELASQCRFNDCAHRTELGRAVREALESGELTEERWESYLKSAGAAPGQDAARLARAPSSRAAGGPGRARRGANAATGGSSGTA